ncbi:MAG: helix-turn-helix domain-containing protein [Bdellovibrionales bacterium]|nr:helix-turn-helix domain-containing protein [Bdellovibrionales bacterium]
MERFSKIKGPQPLEVTKILSSPEPKTIWGSSFFIEKHQREIGWFCHQSGILAHIESGQISIRSESGSLILASGDVIFVPPNCPHLKQQLGVETYGWCINLPASICRKLQTEIILLQSTEVLLAVGRRISEYERSNSHSKQKNLLASVLVEEVKNARAALGGKIPVPISDSLRRVAEQLTSTPSDMQSINFWAKSAGMSRRTFTRAFKNETGLSFSTWRRRIKISAAIRDLENGRSVADIAFYLGYQNPSTFNALFKKQFGMSPSEFVRKYIERSRK